jgi:predicted methyltransferase
VALQVCLCNPWSQELFDNPKITQRIGDSFDVVAELKSGSYSRIIHDPPVFALAGELYSGEFYRQLHRLLRNNGKLFHYIGDPESKSGRSMTAGVIKRLQQAGFRQDLRARAGGAAK